MSEPILERLNRFTPDAGRLDRDALLFAAGRASVRPGRRWQAVAAVLAASQLLTLGLLWPRMPRQGPDAPRPPVISTPPVGVEPPSPTPADAPSWAAHWRLLSDPDHLPAPAASDSLVPDDPPLRASSPAAAVLN